MFRFFAGSAAQLYNSNDGKYRTESRLSTLTRFVFVTGCASAILTLCNRCYATWNAGNDSKVTYAAFTAKIDAVLYHDVVSSSVDELPRVAFSRFDIPWNRTPYVRLSSLAESGHRVLISAISSTGNSGLGHMMAVVNAEVHTAIVLGLTYTHRIGHYGSLSASDRHRVEYFFGWGHGEIPRINIYHSICGETNNASYDGLWRQRGSGKSRKLRRPCMECERIASPGVSRDPELCGMDVRHLLHVPQSVSFSWCNSHEDPELKGSQCSGVREFRAKHSQVRNAIFQMGEEVCDSLPAKSDFSQTRGWFYWHYWKAHGHQPEKSLSRPLHARPSPQLPQREVAVAIHVRRGDFMSALNVGKRKAIPIKTFAQTIREIHDIILDAGGVFAALPIRVFIYSEGQPANPNANDVGHDIEKMTKDFVDIDGQVRDAKWIQDQIGRDVHVTMRISTDTIQAMHEMAAADWFLGSLSGLSTNVIGSLGRGMLLLPRYDCDTQLKVLECFHVETGSVPRAHVLQLWKAYASEFERYVPVDSVKD
jgi:hypothetical protein